MGVSVGMGHNCSCCTNCCHRGTICNRSAVLAAHCLCCQLLRLLTAMRYKLPNRPAPMLLMPCGHPQYKLPASPALLMPQP